MAKNEISKLDGLSDKSELEILHLRENKISTLGGLTSSMASLSYLNLRCVGFIIYVINTTQKTNSEFIFL